jgi:hypothetical protein
VPERTAAQSDIGSKRPAHEGHATRVVAQQIGVRLIKGRLVEAVRSRHRSKPDAAGSGESPVNKCRKNFRFDEFLWLSTPNENLEKCSQRGVDK